MDLFKKVKENSKKIYDAASKTTVQTVDALTKKGEQVAEDVKLKMAISGKQDDIADIYMEIGKSVYASYKSGEDVGKEFTKKCKAIDKINNEISEMNEKLLFNKEQRKCDECGEVIDLDSDFCPNCGTKQKKLKLAEEKEKEREKKEEAKVETEKVCSECGNICEPAVKFCPKCGHKF